MRRKVSLAAALLLAFAAQGALAEAATPQVEAAAPSAPAIIQPAQTADLTALHRAIFGAPQTPAEATPEPTLASVFDTGARAGVACCKPSPCGCQMVPTADACSDLGGYTFGTLQLCARDCCS